MDVSGIYRLADLSHHNYGDIIVQRMSNGHYNVTWTFTDGIHRHNTHTTDDPASTLSIAAVEKWASDPKVWIQVYPNAMLYPEGI